MFFRRGQIVELDALFPIRGQKCMQAVSVTTMIPTVARKEEQGVLGAVRVHSIQCNLTTLQGLLDYVLPITRTYEDQITRFKR